LEVRFSRMLAAGGEGRWAAAMAEGDRGMLHMMRNDAEVWVRALPASKSGRYHVAFNVGEAYAGRPIAVFSDAHGWYFDWEGNEKAGSEAGAAK
jgi:hypothetical protein